jgi:ribosomal 50S subunit-recycling heat shock protein
MRIDVYLNAVNILKSRTLAKEAVERGKVTLNGQPVKASHVVEPGNRIRLDLGTRVLTIEVMELPPGPVAKKLSKDYYDVISDEKVSLDL